MLQCITKTIYISINYNFIKGNCTYATGSSTFHTSYLLWDPVIWICIQLRCQEHFYCGQNINTFITSHLISEQNCTSKIMYYPFKAILPTWIDSVKKVLKSHPTCDGAAKMFGLRPMLPLKRPTKAIPVWQQRCKGTERKYSLHNTKRVHPNTKHSVWIYIR